VLDELSRANRSFARTQALLAAELDTRSLAPRLDPNAAAAIEEALRSQVKDSQLLITGAQVTLYVEEARPNWFRRLLSALGLGKAGEPRYRLAGERGPMRCDFTIARVSSGDLAILAQRFDVDARAAQGGAP